ncbi:FAD-dependent oxidoreductase [Rhodobacter lacus]|uniref:FAD-dependent oxidoreductase n=1 Tax=Rhodobacter lacus TaxID=1641972 RepID=A0ABW5ABY4_9RHOB
MIYKAPDFAFEASPIYDAIVIGAGAVGIPLAVKLARKGLRVALLEAGPGKPRQASQALFERARAVGHALAGLHLGRFRNLGGSTAFWGGQLVPFEPIVFEERPWVSPATWPLSHDEVARHYEEAFEIIGMGDVLRSDEEVRRALKLPPLEATETIQPFFTRWARETNFAVAFAEDLKSMPNLDVLIEAQVSSLSLEGTRVTGAMLTLPGGRRVAVRGAQVVLANGTIEIARLLQLPDSAGRPAPWADNPWLGRCFMDHVDIFAGRIEPTDRKRFSELFDNAVLKGIKYAPKLRLTAAAQKRDQLVEISSHFVYSSSISESLSNLKILVKGLLRGRLNWRTLSDPLGILGSLRFVVPMALRYIRYRRVMNVADRGILLRLTSEQRPREDSRILLADTRDAFGLPEVLVDWRISPEDLETMLAFAQHLKAYLEGNGLARVEIDPALLERSASVIEAADDANHHMGGARMARDASQGVVDPNCQVFGSDNLFVAGAAVYPTSGFANPTFTAIALSMRLADFLLTKEKGAGHATAS